MSTSSAALSAVAQSIPSQGIDFGYCAVGQGTSRTFTLYNPTQTNVRYTLTSDQSYFEVTPAHGKCDHPSRHFVLTSEL